LIAENAGGRWRTVPVGSCSSPGGTTPVATISPSGSPVEDLAPKRAVTT